MNRRSPQTRCEWAAGEKMARYHDEEWGVPLHDDRVLFEYIVLDGAQAGLSWSTILNKRENYREAFDGFDPEKIARYGKRKVDQLLKNSGIVRNRMKITSAIQNAKAFLKVCDEEDGFDKYIWQFVNGKTIVNRWKTMQEIPVKTPESDAMSKALKQRGFNFVGTTICYAFMQAAGMVNDHTVDCFRYKAVKRAKR
ncbi:MAG: DNA-3-methyladenine glycosylase I [Planctomycetes bacterium]|nr:DNA-3-methyladenine glycosylase I [Planctomycetota bacterium]